MGHYSLNLVREGSGPVLVLIHGVAGSYHIWDSVAPYLADQFTLVKIDLLGYGHSPKPRIAYTPEVQTNAIHDTLLRHAIKPPYILVGLSMGVNLALEYSARWPDECQDFIGIGMPYYPDEKEARAGLHNNFWTRLTLERPRFAQFFIPLLWWLGRHGIIRPEKFSRIYTPTMAKDTMRNPYYAFKSNLLHCMVHNPQDNLLKAGENSSRLFIHGDDDEWSNVQSVRRAVAAYPKSIVKELPGVGHNTVVLAPQISAQIIIEYLKNHTINEPAQGAKGYHAPEEASA